MKLDLFGRIGELEHRISVGFARVELGFANVDAKFASVDARFSGIDARFDQMHQTMATNLEVVLAAIKAK